MAARSNSSIGSRGRRSSASLLCARLAGRSSKPSAPGSSLGLHRGPLGDCCVRLPVHAVPGLESPWSGILRVDRRSVDHAKQRCSEVELPVWPLGLRIPALRPAKVTRAGLPGKPAWAICRLDLFGASLAISVCSPLSKQTTWSTKTASFVYLLAGPSLAAPIRGRRGLASIGSHRQIGDYRPELAGRSTPDPLHHFQGHVHRPEALGEVGQCMPESLRAKASCSIA